MRIKVSSVVVDDQNQGFKFYTEILGFVTRSNPFESLPPPGGSIVCCRATHPSATPDLNGAATSGSVLNFRSWRRGANPAHATQDPSTGDSARVNESLMRCVALYLGEEQRFGGCDAGRSIHARRRRLSRAR